MSVLDSVVLQTPSLVTLLGTVVFLLLLYLLSCSSQEQRREPPGPRPLPLLGNLLTLDLKKPHQTLSELAKEYGSVFTVYFGPKKVVVLAGHKAVEEALVKHAVEFGDREITPAFHLINQGHGILFANGDSWKELRRFALTTLRDFGMGKKMSEEKILEECRYLIEEFEKHEGKAFDTNCPVNYATSNIISAIVYGNRFDYSDPHFKTMVEGAKMRIKLVGSASIRVYNMLPWLGSLIENVRTLIALTEDMKRDMSGLIRGLKDTWTSQACRGFVDAFLTRQQKQEESGIADSYYNDNNLIFSVSNLFAAGTDTTGTTLCWSLLIMAKYPHIQDQVQEEISRVIGGRQVLVEDRKNLPYTDAVIHETQRLANIVPMSIPHVTSSDVTFQGYFIKKGTTVIPLLTTVLHDESEWESPHTFNPAHFLDAQGGFVRRDAFLPFSAGRRICLGEGLARMELFLFFTSLLQRFRFSPPPGVTEDDLDLTPAVGFILNPSPHKLCAVSRV